MKVKCLENVCASGSALEAGETYDISDSDYALLKSMGKVTDAPVETKPKKTAKRKVNGSN
nr:hypothetical protein [uncultured Mediterranean phage uvMED]|tara:strand:+ start:1077 stop:1256 length:180 start_codon:yes stop_codon:yes gene_type:complete